MMLQSTRKPVRRLLIVTHRWASLLLGLVLLAVTTSGAILLYHAEIVRWLNPAAYAVTPGPATTSLSQAWQTVTTTYPEFTPTSVMHENGVIRVTDFEQSYTVDPATGQVLGHLGEAPVWLEFTENLHLCALACADHPGYIAALTNEIPGTGWLGWDGANVTLGTLILGVFALLLIYLTLTGLWLWVPRPSRWKSGVTVRWRRGRFARDTDLHKVAGMLVLVPLLIWGITGASYEFEWVKSVWYAATPGSELPEVTPESVDGTDPDVGIDTALAAARAVAPGDPVAIDVPGTDEESATATYTVWLAHGLDPYAHSTYPGNVGVAVDRRTGEATLTYGRASESTSQTIWDSWNYPVHSGFVVNGWWRLIWLLAGLTPIVLAVTGVSTWLVRRRTARNRRQAPAARG